MPSSVTRDSDPYPARLSESSRRRARSLGVCPGRYEPGPYNAITDVAGVSVGHCTVQSEAHGASGRPVRTGVTAISPVNDGIYEQRVQAGSFVLNGAGELSGITQIHEWGLIETPILLTGTLSVGAVSDAITRQMIAEHKTLGISTDVIIPVVGECDDSWLNDARGCHVQAAHVLEALQRAHTGAVSEGSVGAGAGMVTCDFAGGIGTSSRVVPYAHARYTLGVLVLSNFGAREDLIVDGLPLGRMLSDYRGAEARREVYGSIVVVLATDAPLLHAQLNRICKRAALGIGRVGSSAAHGSGEIVLAFSTQNRVPRTRSGALAQFSCLYDAELNPLFQAAVETTEEAILNALCSAQDIHDARGYSCPALPLDALQSVLARRQAALAAPLFA